MDCEKFEQHVIDALYEELDELTAAEHKRHTESCTRCAQVLAGLKNAREVATLPLEEPSDDLEERILAAERTAMRRAPWYTKVVRGAAWAGSLAMRPQLAMAALFVLVVGSSLLLLRARPGTVGAPVAVTQRGEPGPTSDVAEEPKRAEARGAENAPKVGGLREGYRADEDRAEAKKNDPSPIAATPPATVADGAAATASPESASAGEGQDAPKMLADARAAKQKSGCAGAISRLNAVTDKFPSSPEAAQAKQEVADCERQAGPAVAEPPPPPPAAMAPKPMKAPAPSPMPASSDPYRR